MAKTKITDIDLYGLFNLEVTATENEIRRAYKKKALQCHPDKNPDNPKAAELFHQLSQALEVLLDASARSAYDNLLKAQAAAKLRHSALDERRKRFKEDLERKERDAARCSKLSPQEILENQIEQLRKEGSKLVQEEVRRLQRECLEEMLAGPKSQDTAICQLKASWSTEPSDSIRYTDESIRRIFSKYGSIIALAVSDRKALIEFEDPKAAELAVKIEVGFVEAPLKVAYASSKVRKSKSRPSAPTGAAAESLTNRLHRQAAERERLVQEMLQEDMKETISMHK